MNIRRISIAGMAAALAGGASMAMDFIDVAPVVAVTPLYGPASDPRECFVPAYAPPPGMAPAAPGAPMAMAPQPGMPPPAPPQERGMVAPILGGAAGALLGAQVGQGRGRDAATAVGAVAGTVVADRVANPNAGGSMTGAVVGGAAGALLGNQVGQGAGRTAATAAGAIGGSMVGDRMMSTPPPPQGAQYAPQYAPQPGAPMQQTQMVDRCRTVDGATREILRGYSVVYRYLGRDITTTVANHPGPSIRIAVGALDALAPQQAGYQQPGGYPPPAQYPPQQGAPVGYPGGGYTPGAPQQQQQPATPQQMLIQQVPALLQR